MVLLTLSQAARSLPDDPRLQSVRPRLEQLVNKTADDQLPADLLVSKVREGLAKGVPAERIEAATQRLAEGLVAARQFVTARHPEVSPPVELVRALAEARLAGVDLAAADPIVRGSRPTADTARAVAVLTDLSLRGYPTGRASDLLEQVFSREPAAVGRVSATLEVLRREHALTHVESVDALTRGLEGGASLATASNRALSEARNGRGQGKHKPGRDTGGQDGFVPPGQLKKQSGTKGRPATPGRSLGPK